MRKKSKFFKKLHGILLRKHKRAAFSVLWFSIVFISITAFFLMLALANAMYLPVKRMHISGDATSDVVAKPGRDNRIPSPPGHIPQPPVTAADNDKYFPPQGNYDNREGNRYHRCTDSDCDDVLIRGSLTSTSYNIIIPPMEKSLEDIEDFCLPPEARAVHDGDLVEFTCGIPSKFAKESLNYNNVYLNIVECENGCADGACIKNM